MILTIYDISAPHNWHRSELVQAKIGAGQNWHKKKLTNFVVFGLIKKKIVYEANSFAFNGNSLHWKHDCIFALPLRSSVNYYYKQVISAQSQ